MNKMKSLFKPLLLILMMAIITVCLNCPPVLAGGHSNHNGNSQGEQILVGALVGAATGALIGAVTYDSGSGGHGGGGHGGYGGQGYYQPQGYAPAYYGHVAPPVVVYTTRHPALAPVYYPPCPY